MGKLSDLLKATDQLRELEYSKMRLLEDQWALEKEVDRLHKGVKQHSAKIGLEKEGIWNAVCDLKLNRREDAPSSTDDFCDAVATWVERANTIRKANVIVRLDGGDLDVPDVDIHEEKPEPRPCYPCKVHREVLKVLDEMRPQYCKVLRIRYSIRENERYSDAPGRLPYQWYIAQQMGVSSSTVSRLLKKAIRAVRHPYRSDHLLKIVSEAEVQDIQCPAEYMVAHICDLWDKK